MQGGTYLRVLITGGNRYVGRPLTRELDHEHHVAMLDSLRYRKLRFSQKEAGYPLSPRRPGAFRSPYGRRRGVLVPPGNAQSCQ